MSYNNVNSLQQYSSLISILLILGSFAINGNIQIVIYVLPSMPSAVIMTLFGKYEPTIFWLVDNSEDLYKAQANLLVSDGYRDAGYVYVNIDDCWAAKSRVNGKLVPDAKRFPNGMRKLSDYVSSDFVATKSMFVW